MEKDTIVIHFKSKMITLSFEEFDTDIDIDELVKIHYDNLMGEILTISALLNKVGWLKAEAQDSVRQASLDLAILEAQTKEHYRKTNTVKTQDAKGNAKIKAPTQNEVDNMITTDENCIKTKKRLFRVEKEYDYVDSLYWAVKSKDQKLNRIADSLKPEEYERDIVEGKINGILIKAHKKTI